MAQTQRVYSPQEVQVNWAGVVPIKDFADGSAIEVSRNEDNSKQMVGMQGDVGLTYSANKTGQVSFNIMQTGTTNQVLSGVQNLQDVSGQLVRGDITISDPSGSTICLVRNAHIMSTPTVTLGDDQASKTWVFFAERVDFIETPVGLNVPVTAAARIRGLVDGIKSVSDALDGIL